MNKNKKGRPYEFPKQFIKFMAFAYIIFDMPYRQMEGFTRKLSELIPPLKAADYTTLQKRIVKMKLELDATISEKIDDVIIAVDSMRWASEGTLSAVKRIFGGTMRMRSIAEGGDSYR